MKNKTIAVKTQASWLATKWWTADRDASQETRNSLIQPAAFQAAGLFIPHEKLIHLL